MKALLRLSLFAVILDVWLLSGPTVRAATNTVSSTADSGAGSLRGAIVSANSGDTIIFAGALSGQTIHLTSGKLFIPFNLTIDASALSGGIFLDAGKNSRVLEVTNGNVTINSLTLTNGSAAGALFPSNFGGGIIVDSGAIVTINNSTFSSNSASVAGGGLCNIGGTVTLNDCTFFGNSAGTGGGIQVAGPVTLNRCTFIGNAGHGGGGIYNGNTVALNNCIFSNNSAGSAAGGGVYNDFGSVDTMSNCVFASNFAGGGGGIYSNNGSVVTVRHCTFSDNAGGSVGGAFFNDNSSTVIVNNCTIFGNHINGQGGGIYCYRCTLRLNNCTIVGNSAGSGPGGGVYNESSTIAMTNTIVASNTASSSSDISGSYSGINNFVGGNPQLASLGNCGGFGKTMPPVYGSAVIDAGVDSATNFLIVDQRGYPRIFGAHVDIGAVEAQIAPTNNRPKLQSSTNYTNGFQFTFTNVPKTDFTVLVSTNLALPVSSWTIFGNAIEISSGQYQLTDASATNGAQRFYRVVSP